MSDNIRPAVSAAHRSLSELGLDADTRGRVLKQLHADGLLYDDRGGALFASADRHSSAMMPEQVIAGAKRNLIPLQTPLQAAADPANERVLRVVQAECRRFGFDLKANAIVDVDELNRTLAKSSDLDRRWALKANMAACKLIP